MAQAIFKVQRPRNADERGRNLPPVVAHIKGWSNTHVLFDVVIGGKLKTQDLTRPIERFMACYGLSA